LNSLLGQLNVNTSHRRNGGMSGGVLSPQSLNLSNISKHQYSNSSYMTGGENYRDNCAVKQQQVPKDNTQNMSYNFPSVSLENTKAKYKHQENLRAGARSQVNPSNLRLNNVPVATMKVKVKPETVKASFQKYFAAEAGLSVQRPGEFYLNATVLNSPSNTSAVSYSKKVRFEDRNVNSGYEGSFLNGTNNAQKKGALKSLENIISRGLNGSQSTKNKENKVEVSIDDWVRNLNETMFTQR